ncbi:hypothetical protein SAY87_026585 [Trapa incisa]|uniref:Outer arm dynein light chain 1 protein n=1 Tax=Trapa incisa TaxID=236973 RepID=A0AAN7JEA3_9MYRT|nr:hypothetical protein SAY87_026585 [Trapa incisa]
MAIVTGDRYVEKLVKFVEAQAGPLIEGTLVLKLNPVGLHYVQSRLESLQELERLLSGAPVDYLRAYVSDLGDHRALEQLRRILCLLTSLKVVSVLPPPARDPTPLSLLPFGRLKFLELRGCDLSTSAAKGLLELRHTLEKLICQNSTDALQHVFASRIADIKKSPQWTRLSFVSCACNSLILMDESLQLLPAIVTLDLSRNKFTKVDNLRKCIKLKHLDLGFNNLRTVASLNEVPCHIVKLVLRNNALTSLHGIEKLKSLEGLDISYNMISNFSELEILSSLPMLLSLWLEGNPICFARWYRAQVFSFVPYPEKLKIDDKGISTREFWKRQIIIARRQKRPSSFGFYFPVKDDAESEGIINRKKKRQTRLASIESEEESVCICSDQESVSCDNEMPDKEENFRDDEAGIVDWMNRVELLKKERSILWLREVKQWMDQGPENMVGTLNSRQQPNSLKNITNLRHFGESSRYMSDSIQTTVDENNSNDLESDASLAGLSLPLHVHQNADLVNCSGIGEELKQGKLQPHIQEGVSTLSEHFNHTHSESLANEKIQMVGNSSGTPLTAFDDIMESHSSSAYPGSPPHYKEDILHRRNNLVEEILQLSADSYSVVSSDSNTSCSDDELNECRLSHINSPLNEGFPCKSVDMQIFDGTGLERCQNLGRSLQYEERNGQSIDSFPKQMYNAMEQSQPLKNDDSAAHDYAPDFAHLANQDNGSLRNIRNKRKAVKRVVSLPYENNVAGKLGISRKSSFDVNYDGPGDGPEHGTSNGAAAQEVDASIYGRKCTFNQNDKFIDNYFQSTVAKAWSNETCKHYIRCDCVLEQESLYREREVAVLLSNEGRIYILLIGTRFDGSGIIISMLGCHMIDDVKEVLIGMGLQVLRVNVDGGPAYVFITKSIEKARQLMEILQVTDACSLEKQCALRSLEPTQFEVFSTNICGGSKLNIYQYSMILFWHSGKEGKSWFSRSLFVTKSHLIICTEDIKQFGSLSTGSHSPPYFSLILCCNIADVSEMIIVDGENRSVILELDRASSQWPPAALAAGRKVAVDSLTWKFKWFSEKSWLQFGTLLKALHAQTPFPLFVRYVP